MRKGQDGAIRRRSKLPTFIKEEVRLAFHLPNPKKAPRLDELSFEVWRKVYHAVKTWVRYIFQTSIDRAYLPQTWKTAKIVVIRKAAKADYTLSKAYRPISLLQTLSKALELAIARRISYLTETYDLLPENHSGGRRQRSCEQALNVLVEKIHDAGRVGKVLSLVTFDIQGAFNGVCTDTLCQRLQQRWVKKSRSG